MINRFTNPAELDAQMEELARMIGVDMMLSNESVDHETAAAEEFYYEDDGQPTEYEEWQDVYGGDDWDHGQYDEVF